MMEQVNLEKDFYRPQVKRKQTRRKTEIFGIDPRLQCHTLAKKRYSLLITI